MKRITFIAGGSAALIAAAISAVVMLASGASGATPPPPPVVSSGVSVARTAFGTADQAILSRIGATGAITKVGSLGGTAFYSIAGSDGGHCYAVGSDTVGGLSGGCMPAQASVPAVVDLSNIVMNPADGSWKLDTLEGIAADGIAQVGFADASGALHTTPVVGNVYRLAWQALSGGPSSQIVGLDANGNRVFTEALGTP